MNKEFDEIVYQLSNIATWLEHIARTLDEQQDTKSKGRR